jgi:acyl carrier protein
MEFDAGFEDKIVALIAQAVPGRYRKVKIAPHTQLQRDLGIDSLGIVALLFGLEGAFGIEIGDHAADLDLGRLRTVSDAIATSRRILERAKPGSP